MQFDEEGHILFKPKPVYDRAGNEPLRLINDLLCVGTPWAFKSYRSYCDFLEAVSERTAVHPKNLFIRGSSQIGFSIAPKRKVWTAMGDKSDLDLAIIDAEYFSRVDGELLKWESQHTTEYLQGMDWYDYAGRQMDRTYYCCRDKGLPTVVAVHHQDTIANIRTADFCGSKRALNAFIFRDWWSVRRRYEFDLGQLCRGIAEGWLPQPPDEPFPRVATAATEPKQEAARKGKRGKLR